MREKEERQVPEVLLDYAFIRREDEKRTVTVLLTKDRESRAMRASVMKHKGACTEAESDRAVENVKSFGHTCKIIIKTDNENALKSWRDGSDPEARARSDTSRTSSP